MEIVYVLLPMALLMSAAGLGFFTWAIKSGQFDDLEGPRWRVLYEDDQPVRRPASHSPSLALSGGATTPAGGPAAELASAAPHVSELASAAPHVSGLASAAPHAAVPAEATASRGGQP